MANEPTLEEIKNYLRIDGEEEDTLLAMLLITAKEHCENYLNEALPEELPSPIKQSLLILISHFLRAEDWRKYSDSRVCAPWSISSVKMVGVCNESRC